MSDLMKFWLVMGAVAVILALWFAVLTRS